MSRFVHPYMVPARKGHVCVHERAHWYTEQGTNHQVLYHTLTICVIHAANVNGFAIKVADAASGAVREVGHCDRVFMVSGVTAEAVRAQFSGLCDAEVESLDESNPAQRGVNSESHADWRQRHRD